MTMAVSFEDIDSLQDIDSFLFSVDPFSGPGTKQHDERSSAEQISDDLKAYQERLIALQAAQKPPTIRFSGPGDPPMCEKLAAQHVQDIMAPPPSPKALSVVSVDESTCPPVPRFAQPRPPFKAMVYELLALEPNTNLAAPPWWCELILLKFQLNQHYFTKVECILLLVIQIYFFDEKGKHPGDDVLASVIDYWRKELTFDLPDNQMICECKNFAKLLREEFEGFQIYLEVYEKHKHWEPLAWKVYEGWKAFKAATRKRYAVL
ncbi:hypothetical protein MMC28_002878 [Mycoblastus sanguinarius]|nr:hypothetical protein [Mycoblastus sanguinarius]